MSFLIENILKKEYCSGGYIRNTILEQNTGKSEMIRNSSDEFTNHNILQQTLLHRVNPYCAEANSHRFNRKESPSASHCSKRDFYLEYPDFCNINERLHISLYPKRRFFTTYYESLPLLLHNASKRKGGQIRFSSSQTDALEEKFNMHKYLSPEDRKILADSLKLTDKQVKTWFQNRRAKWRRCNNSLITCSAQCEKQLGEKPFNYKESIHNQI